jgi:hypothetical protein
MRSLDPLKAAAPTEAPDVPRRASVLEDLRMLA